MNPSSVLPGAGHHQGRADGAPAAPASRPGPHAIPNLLTIAGVDPSGGAGVLADIKTFSALGAYGCAVICALTAQNTRAVTGIQGVSPDFIRQQIDTLFDDVRIDAAKLGMLGTVPIVRAVADALHPMQDKGSLPPLVVDPVMVSKGGDVLLAPDAIRLLMEAVLPLASLITPNLPEAGLLLSQSAPEDLPAMRRAAERLRRLMADDGRRWVLLKGGHLQGEITDLLFDGDRMIELPAQRIQTRNLHGTGCTLSAAIAALLPQRPDMPTAVREALHYLAGALRASGQLQVGDRSTGRGHGPVHHFHHLWRAPATGA